MGKEETSEEIIETIDARKLNLRNETYYKEVPFTGIAVSHHQDGQKECMRLGMGIRSSHFKSKKGYR